MKLQYVAPVPTFPVPTNIASPVVSNTIGYAGSSNTVSPELTSTSKTLLIDVPVSASLNASPLGTT